MFSTLSHYFVVNILSLSYVLYLRARVIYFLINNTSTAPLSLSGVAVHADVRYLYSYYYMYRLLLPLCLLLYPYYVQQLIKLTLPLKDLDFRNPHKFSLNFLCMKIFIIGHLFSIA